MASMGFFEAIFLTGRKQETAAAARDIAKSRAT
jgi:hypothetical protein